MIQKSYKITADYQIIFFDGVCNLCNGFLNFIIQRDRKHSFRFASLQGEKANQILAKDQIYFLDSLILFDQGRTYDQSTAVLKILCSLGWVWKILYPLLLIPAPMRNGVYKFISNNRYRFFGKSSTCRVPSCEERRFFLD